MPRSRNQGHKGEKNYDVGSKTLRDIEEVTHAALSKRFRLLNCALVQRHRCDLDVHCQKDEDYLVMNCVLHQ